MTTAESQSECSPELLIFFTKRRYDPRRQALKGEPEKSELLVKRDSVFETRCITLFCEEIKDGIVAAIVPGGGAEGFPRGGTECADGDHLRSDTVDLLDGLAIAGLPAVVRQHRIEPKAHRPAGGLHLPGRLESRGRRWRALLPPLSYVLGIHRP
jgi:hypothetical protein